MAPTEETIIQKALEHRIKNYFVTDAQNLKHSNVHFAFMKAVQLALSKKIQNKPENWPEFVPIATSPQDDPDLATLDDPKNSIPK